MANQCPTCRVLFRNNPGTCPACGSPVAVNGMADQGFLARGYRYAEDARSAEENYQDHLERMRSQFGSQQQPATPAAPQRAGAAPRQAVPGFGAGPAPAPHPQQPRQPRPKAPGFGAGDSPERMQRPIARPAPIRRPNRQPHQWRRWASRVNWSRVIFALAVIAALWLIRSLALALWANRDNIVSEVIRLMTPLITLYIMFLLFKRIIWPDGRKKD